MMEAVCMRLLRGSVLLAACVCLSAQQVIEFESNGLQYKTMTKNGVTVMCSPLPAHVREYAIMQVAVANGAPVSWTIKPEDFDFKRADGTVVRAAPAGQVVTELVNKASRSDVIRLVHTYEVGLYGNTHMQSTNGYEARRESAIATMTATKLNAAAAASAIALVRTKLEPGQSTDGAIFFAIREKVLGPGRLIVHAAGEVFNFEVGD